MRNYYAMCKILKHFVAIMVVQIFIMKNNDNNNTKIYMLHQKLNQNIFFFENLCYLPVVFKTLPSTYIY